MTDKDWGPAHHINENDPMGFPNMFPSETRGDGLIRKNNSRTGAGQGRGGVKRKVCCAQCGFFVDINKVDHSGGSLDGSGAGGAITKTADVGTLSNGETTDSGGMTHYVGEQAVKKGSGCAFCFSKNSTKVRNLVQTPTPRPRGGF